MKLSDVVNQVIALGDAIRNYWDRELPKRYRDYPLVHPGEDDGPPPPEEKQLKALLESLPEDMIYKLTLIMRLGWEAFGVDDLAKQYEVMKDRYGPREDAIAIMMQKAPLADYLADGLDVLRKNDIDVDTLLSAHAAARN